MWNGFQEMDEATYTHGLTQKTEMFENLLELCPEGDHQVPAGCGEA